MGIGQYLDNPFFVTNIEIKSNSIVMKAAAHNASAECPELTATDDELLPEEMPAVHAFRRVVERLYERKHNAYAVDPARSLELVKQAADAEKSLAVSRREHENLAKELESARAELAMVQQAKVDAAMPVETIETAATPTQSEAVKGVSDG